MLLAQAERGIAGKESHSHGNGAAADSDLAERQQQFDMYQAEMGVDSVHLQEDAIAAQREVTQLTAQVAKANMKLEIMGGPSHQLLWFMALTNQRIQITSRCCRSNRPLLCVTWMT